MSTSLDPVGSFGGRSSSLPCGRRVIRPPPFIICPPVCIRRVLYLATRRFGAELAGKFGQRSLGNSRRDVRVVCTRALYCVH
jgi:hypothetical protein